MDDLDDEKYEDEGMGGPGLSIRAPYQPNGFGEVESDFGEEIFTEVEDLLAA